MPALSAAPVLPSHALQDYGEYYPESVTLGGKLYTVADANASASAFGEKSTKVKVKKQSFSLGFISWHKTKITRKDKAEAREEAESEAASNAHAVGGNVLVSADRGAWAQTLEQPRFWRVIEYGTLQSVAGLVPEQYRDKVRAALRNEGIKM